MKNNKMNIPYIRNHGRKPSIETWFETIFNPEDTLLYNHNDYEHLDAVKEDGQIATNLMDSLGEFCDLYTSYKGVESYNEDLKQLINKILPLVEP